MEWNSKFQFFIFPGKRMQEELLEGASAGVSGTLYESDWSNTEIFSQNI